MLKFIGDLSKIFAHAIARKLKTKNNFFFLRLNRTQNNMTYDFENPGYGLGQTHKWWRDETG
jgi:hypothetical protein